MGERKYRDKGLVCQCNINGWLMLTTPSFHRKVLKFLIFVYNIRKTNDL